MKKLLAALALILAVNASAQQQAKSWLEGQHSGVKEPLAVAVQDSQKWEEIWKQHAGSAPKPEVDFSQTSVVVVFLGKTENAGVKVTVVVQQDPLDSNRINVFYRRTAVKKGMSAQVECQPYAMVKIPRAAVIDIEADAPVSIPERLIVPAASKNEAGRRVRALIQSFEHPSFE